jgi:hypothetical protein
MSPRLRCLAALTAALAPARAERLLSLLAGGSGHAPVTFANALVRGGREGRLSALAEIAAGDRDGAGPTHPLLRRLRVAPPSAARTAARPLAPRNPAEGFSAHRGTSRETELHVMASPIPMPTVSRGFAVLTPAAAASGCELVPAVARALSDQLGFAVGIAARALPAPAARLRGTARVTFVLEALPGAPAAALEVEAGLVAAILARLAGVAPGAPAALQPTEAEQGLLDLLALVSLDAVRDGALAALSPRLADVGGEAAGALVVALELTAGDARGAGRLLVPPAALVALGPGYPELDPAQAALELAASLREGTCTLTRDELFAAAPGDVLLLDGDAPRSTLVLPGGFTLIGARQGDAFHVQELGMTESQSAYPITVAVEIGRVTLTLGELARAAPGAVLPLDVRRDGAVVLRAGERALARGVLVDVEGSLGVRVVELGERP